MAESTTTSPPARTSCNRAGCCFWMILFIGLLLIAWSVVFMPFYSGTFASNTGIGLRHELGLTDEQHLSANRYIKEAYLRLPNVSRYIGIALALLSIAGIRAMRTTETKRPGES